MEKQAWKLSAIKGEPNLAILWEVRQMILKKAISSQKATSNLTKVFQAEKPFLAEKSILAEKPFLTKKPLHYDAFETISFGNNFPADDLFYHLQHELVILNWTHKFMIKVHYHSFVIGQKPNEMHLFEMKNKQTFYSILMLCPWKGVKDTIVRQTNKILGKS